MDFQMPEMNGFEAARYIRSILKYKIPIIALTADVTTADLEKCRTMGMDDYISKPVDERILYKKIADLLKRSEHSQKNRVTTGSTKCVDLTYLYKRTKGNPDLMTEMIELYLGQTPSLISSMNQSLLDKDWDSLHKSVHKLIPSFSIMGIHKDYEEIAKKIQEYSGTQQHLNKIRELVLQTETVCLKACEELRVPAK
jgi:CheY-like chemotaxis protein